MTVTRAGLPTQTDRGPTRAHHLSSAVTTTIATSREARRPQYTPSTTVVAVVVTITAVLLLDADGSLGLQRSLGAVTWVVLLGLLARETSLVRAQTAIVVVFATLIEYTFSPWLQVYVYRFDNVPAYVPPGHGLVYLAALCIGRMAWVRAQEHRLMVGVLVAGGVYAAYGVTLAERPDVLGAFWYLCLAGFLLWGPSRGLYVGAFVVVTYLEILGTAVGTWEWQRRDPFGIVAIGNPPSGAAGGYGWFDLAALLGGPAVAGAVQRLRCRLVPVARWLDRR